LRIAYIIPVLSSGGAETLLTAIIEELHQRNHEILLICLHPHHETFYKFPNKDFILDEIKPVVTQSRVKFSILGKTQVDNQHYKKLITDFKPDIIHSHLFEAEIVARSYIYAQAKYFSHGHDNMIQLKKWSSETIKNKINISNYVERSWLIKQYKKSNTTFIAISKDVNDYLKFNLPKVLGDRVHIVKNGFNFERYFVARAFKIQNSQQINMVSVGNLVKKKNHNFLIDIALELRKRKINFHFDVLGFGPLKEVLQTRINENHLENEIILHGNVGNVREFMAKADLYVHPATYEPFGLVLLEAMAAGLPVITLDGSGNRDIMENGRNGYLIGEQNPITFADTIFDTWNDEKKYAKMSELAQQYSSEYDIAIYVDLLENLYNRTDLKAN